MARRTVIVVVIVWARSCGRDGVRFSVRARECSPSAAAVRPQTRQTGPPLQRARERKYLTRGYRDKNCNTPSLTRYRSRVQKRTRVRAYTHDDNNTGHVDLYAALRAGRRRRRGSNIRCRRITRVCRRAHTRRVVHVLRKLFYKYCFFSLSPPLLPSGLLRLLLPLLPARRARTITRRTVAAAREKVKRLQTRIYAYIRADGFWYPRDELLIGWAGLGSTYIVRAYRLL